MPARRLPVELLHGGEFNPDASDHDDDGEEYEIGLLTVDKVNRLRSSRADQTEGTPDLEPYKCRTPIPAMSDYGPKSLTSYMRKIAERSEKAVDVSSNQSKPEGARKKPSRSVFSSPEKRKSQLLLNDDYIGPVTRARAQSNNTAQPCSENLAVVSNKTSINNKTDSPPFPFTTTNLKGGELTSSKKLAQLSIGCETLHRGVKRKAVDEINSSTKQVRKFLDEDQPLSPHSSLTKSKQTFSKVNIAHSTSSDLDLDLGGQTEMDPDDISSLLSQPGQQNTMTPGHTRGQSSRLPEVAHPRPSTRGQDQVTSDDGMLHDMSSDGGEPERSTDQQLQEDMRTRNSTLSRPAQALSSSKDDSQFPLPSPSNGLLASTESQNQSPESNTTHFQFGTTGCKCLHNDRKIPIPMFDYAVVNVRSNATKPDNNFGSVLLRSNPEYLSEFPAEIWETTKQYLSVEEIRSLRLVNKATAQQLAPHLFRSAVVNFDRDMFGVPCEKCDKSQIKVLPANSMIRKYGHLINKFGISFEFDSHGLSHAPEKQIDTKVDAWFGSYNWPKPEYPRTALFEELESLAEKNNCALLGATFTELKNISELALSLDSGHGWLHGPDISDLALFELRRNGGSKVFGCSFLAKDQLIETGLREYFHAAQANTLGAATQAAGRNGDPGERHIWIQTLPTSTRNYDEYQDPAKQPDADPQCHTGGVAGRVGGLNARGFAFNPPDGTTADDVALYPIRSSPDTIPQWPIIFNCYNLAAEFGGDLQWAQYNVGCPAWFPYHPGYLTESQVQYLMESVWTQRIFLSAYTASLAEKAFMLRNIHSLHIAKLSSGLLGSISNPKFWNSLQGLSTLTLMVIPDWRKDHVVGDKLHPKNMLIDPVEASRQLTDVLANFIAPLENLSKLTIGFVGGGEHAIGMFARNDHVLPAPITLDHEAWISDHVKKPNPKTLITFNHIRELKFENCWFSPCMLEGFMARHRDSSLHSLILDSVSLTGTHSTRIGGPLNTIDNHLRCKLSRSMWLHEKLPVSACWVKVLDNITPGTTLLDRKVEAEMIEKPTTAREFRGNLKQITLNSCGYVKISGCSDNTFNQNSLVEHKYAFAATDQGLRARQARFQVVDESVILELEHQNRFLEPQLPQFKKIPIMMGVNDPLTERPWWGLGKLTSCVHPLEKRILESAWGMKFGWGDDMGRWRAVEDGCWEGGTGRFSGTINKL